MKITLNTQVVMPEPNRDDFWLFGGFVASVRDYSKSGNLIVEDQDSDFWEVEPERGQICK